MRPTEEKIQKDPSDLPIYLFKQGNNCEAYRYFGVRLQEQPCASAIFSEEEHLEMKPF